MRGTGFFQKAGPPQKWLASTPSLKLEAQTAVVVGTTTGVCALLQVFGEGVRGNPLSSERGSPAQAVLAPGLSLSAGCCQSPSVESRDKDGGTGFCQGELVEPQPVYLGATAHRLKADATGSPSPDLSADRPPYPLHCSRDVSSRLPSVVACLVVVVPLGCC